MKAATEYLQGVRQELSKVIWPKKEEIIRLTLVVLAISAIIGLYLGVLDFFLTRLLEVLISS